MLVEVSVAFADPESPPEKSFSGSAAKPKPSIITAIAPTIQPATVRRRLL
ncbi:hypothetical protein [Actinomadura sp. 3N407]